MEKARRIDYWPDEMIAGIAGQLDPEEFGVYWMVCTLIYSRGGRIKDDPAWIAGIFRKTSVRTIRSVLDRLEASAKVVRIDGELVVNRCLTELEITMKRTRTWRENGTNGGRNSKKNNSIEEPSGFSDQEVPENRAFNYQLPTTNHIDSTPYIPPSESGSPDCVPAGADQQDEAPAGPPGRKPANTAGRGGTRVPDGDLPPDWAAAANHTRERHQLPLLGNRTLGLRWESFRNYWRGVAGSKGLKRDWKATWLNDCISPVTERKFPPDAPTSTATKAAKPQASDLRKIPTFFDKPQGVSTFFRKPS